MAISTAQIKWESLIKRSRKPVLGQMPVAEQAPVEPARAPGKHHPFAPGNYRPVTVSAPQDGNLQWASKQFPGNSDSTIEESAAAYERQAKTRRRSKPRKPTR